MLQIGSVPVERGIVLAAAVLLDLALGDPPNRYHPVAWVGRAIGAAVRCAPAGGKAARFAFGAAIAVVGAALCAGVGHLVSTVLLYFPGPARWIVEATALKMTFSLRGLLAAAGQVAEALERGDLPEARRLLSWHLVSRPTATLEESGVAAAAVESVAENSSDGVVAPLLYYVLGGLPAAMAYRFLNTADAMLGYRDPEHEWLGKAPARLDDVANLLPARVAALCLVAASLFRGARARDAWRVWKRDRYRTASPNAGHPMSAMAGALGVELEKVGCYRLNAGGARTSVGDVRRALRLLCIAAGISAVLLAGLCLGGYLVGRGRSGEP